MRRALHRICLTLCLALSLFIAWRWRQSHVDPRTWRISSQPWTLIENRGKCTIVGGRIFDDLYPLLFNISPAGKSEHWFRITSIPIQVGAYRHDPMTGPEPVMAIDSAKLNRIIEILGKLSPAAREMLQLPFWLLLLISAAYPTLTLTPAAYRKSRTWHRFAPGHCPKCNDDLRASPTRCPECGTPIPIPTKSPNPSV